MGQSTDETQAWTPEQSLQLLSSLPDRSDVQISTTDVELKLLSTPFVTGRAIVGLIVGWILLSVLVVSVATVCLHASSLFEVDNNTTFEPLNFAMAAWAGISLFFGLVVFASCLMAASTVTRDKNQFKLKAGSLVLAASLDDVVGVRSVLRRRYDLVFNGDPPGWWPIRIEPGGALDVIMRDGVIRTLSILDHSEVQWLADAMSVLLEVPREREIDLTERRGALGPDDKQLVVKWKMTPTRLRRTLCRLCLLGGVALFLLGAWHIPLGRASRTWPTAEGTVIRVESTIKGETVFTMEGDAKVQYEYVVNGNTYENDRIWYAIRTNTRPIKQLADGLHPGSPVTVYYDPGNPARSVLLTGHDPNNWSLLVLSLLGPVGGWMLWNRRLDADQEELLKRYVRADTSGIK